MRKTFFINGIVALVLSLLVLGGCAQNGRNLGVNIIGGQNPQSVIYTKHGRISGQAVNYKLTNYKYESSQKGQYGQSRQYYAHRKGNGDLGRNMNDMIPNDTYKNQAQNNVNNQYQVPNQGQDYTNQAAPQNNTKVTPSPTNQKAPAQNKQTTPSQQNAPSANKPSDSALQEVVKLVNQERTKRGLQALKVDPKLMSMAKTKANDMLNNHYFSHTSPTYGSPFDMMKKLGISYSAAGENIAEGQTSAQKVMTDWMNSPGHRANILNKDFTYIGVGHTGSQNYWVQEFIKK